MGNDVLQRIAQAIGREPESMRPLSGGCVGEVYRTEMPHDERLVVKVDRQAAGGLEIEGYMLRYLAERSLPVPAVHHADETLLIMDFVEAGGRSSPEAERHAADLLAALHQHSDDRFGLERDTLIGGLHQPNPRETKWIDFFRRHRLLYMADEAERAGRLPGRLRRRLDAMAERLDDLLDEPEAPSLIHGDVWGGNVLADGDRIAAFLDPAIYYAHPEIELAFITMFNTFGRAFFDRYHERRPIQPGFFETRRDVYNLYPLLVHVRLFGGGYVGGVERTLRRFGC